MFDATSRGRAGLRCLSRVGLPLGVGSVSLGALLACVVVLVLGASVALGALPDGRVYEMVTPVENENAEVYVPDWPVEGAQTPTSLLFQASAEGNAIAYIGGPSSGGNGSSGFGGGNQYLATRSPLGGWTQVAIQPTGYATPEYEAFSSDLSVGVLDSNDPTPLSAEAPGDGYSVLYTRTADGGYRPLFTTTPPNRTPNNFETFGVSDEDPSLSHVLTFAGGSSDFSHLLFEANDALTANAVDGGEEENNLYESVDGQLRLVNVLPDETTGTPNATFGGPGLTGERVPAFSHAISADGSRIFWTDLSTGNLYVRENGTTTVLVAEGAQFRTASSDGSKVLFIKNGDPYVFDVETDQTSDLAPSGEVQGVVGASEDLEYVYFVAKNGSLAAGGTAGRPNLYVWHGGVTTFIATLSPGDNEVHSSGSGTADWIPNLAHRTAEVTPDGHSVVFMSERSLTGYSNIGKFSNNVSGPFEEVYVYDVDSGKLSCVSCNPSGAPPVNHGGYGGYLPVGHNSTYLPRWISTDGSRVFFDTEESLVAQDVNGWQDVYEWEREGAGGCQNNGGCVSLVSDGVSSDASFLADASASGNDVFIVTRAQLVAQDRNENFNLYDARVGGVQQGSASGCSGTACQSMPPVQPSFAIPSSATFSGVGDLTVAAPSEGSAPRAKPLTRAQKLAVALKACRVKRDKRRRIICETQAKRRDAVKASVGKSDRRGK